MYMTQIFPNFPRGANLRKIWIKSWVWLGCPRSDPTFDSDFCNMSSIIKNVLWWDLSHTQKTENLFLIKIPVESTLKNRDLGHPRSDPWHPTTSPHNLRISTVTLCRKKQQNSFRTAHLRYVSKNNSWTSRS